MSYRGQRQRRKKRVYQLISSRKLDDNTTLQQWSHGFTIIHRNKTYSMFQDHEKAMDFYKNQILTGVIG